MLHVCLGFVSILSPLHLLFVLPVRWAEERLDLAGTAQVEPRAQEHHCEIEENEYPHDAEITPVHQSVSRQTKAPFTNQMYLS